MTNEPWAPEAPGGGEAPKPLHHHVLEEHLGGVALVIDEKERNMLWSGYCYMILYVSNSKFFHASCYMIYVSCYISSNDIAENHKIFRLIW